MSDSVAQDQIKSYVDRILRLKEEAKAINADIRDIYAEAKSSGFDKTVLGKLVNYVEKRATDAAALAEGESLFGLYLEAYDSAAPSRAHARARESAPAWKPPPLPEHDAETGEITEPQSPSAAQGSGEAPAVASQPIQPETATEKRASEASHLGDAAARQRSEEDAVDPVVPISAHREVLPERADAGSSSGRTADFDSANDGSNPSPVAIELPEVPADFITDQTSDQLAARMRRTLKARPGCKRPWSCGRMADQSECGQCLKAAQEEGQAA